MLYEPSLVKYIIYVSLRVRNTCMTSATTILDTTEKRKWKKKRHNMISHVNGTYKRFIWPLCIPF